MEDMYYVKISSITRKLSSTSVFTTQITLDVNSLLSFQCQTINTIALIQTSMLIVPLMEDSTFLLKMFVLHRIAS